MKFQNQDILYELQELAPFLAQLDRSNPFSVPKNYFQSTQQPFDDDLNNATDSVFRKIEQSGKTTAFAVPQYYFDDMHDQILLTIAADTLADEPNAPLLQQMGKQNGMNIPKGYFDELHESVMIQVLEEKTETPLNLSANSSFKVPEGYFDNFASNLLNKIQTIEAETEPATPNLDQIGKKTGFIVPIGYFDQAAKQIQQIQNLGTKVIPMPQRTTQNSTTANIRTIIRYSLSAAAMLAMFVVGMQFLNQPNNNLAQIDNNSNPLLASNDQNLVAMSQGDLLNFMDENVTAETAKAYVLENIDEFEDVLEDDEIVSKMNIEKSSLSDFNIDPKEAQEMLKDLD